MSQWFRLKDAPPLASRVVMTGFLQCDREAGDEVERVWQCKYLISLLLPLQMEREEGSKEADAIEAWEGKQRCPSLQPAEKEAAWLGVAQ